MTPSVATVRRDKRNPAEKRARFVATYLATLNATQAAIDAGYSAKTAIVTGSQLLKHPHVVAMLERARAAALVKVDINQTRVLDELSALAFSDATDYAVDDQGNLVPAPGRPKSVMRAVASIKRKVRVTTDPATGHVTREYELDFKLWDKPGSLKLAGRHVGLFASRDKEQIEAQAQAIVDKLLEKARQQRAAAQAEADHREDERQRAIDVGEAAPPVEPGKASDGNG